jgi:hypothetical protein
VRDTDSEEDRKAGRKQIAERDDSGRSEQCCQDLLVLAEPIGESRNNRPGDQSDSGSRRQHRADLGGAKPALMKKRGQEWGRDPERRKHCAVEK